ncbi:MAG TPA: PH domain-containing protein [Kiritimatiellia bacterium]|nr:PH domain-containing protein [Kiritimatiellia bacterium]
MNAATQDESTIFELKPAYRARLGLLVWGVLLLPVVGLGLFLLARAWYLVASTRYRLTTQRLFAETGLIAKNLEEVELFRVKDVTLRQGVLDRLLGVGTVTVLSTDDTAPELELAGIRDPLAAKEALRTAFRAARQREGLRTGEFIAS